MSETGDKNADFIPVSQSTPVHAGWQRRNQHLGGHQNRYQNQNGFNKRSSGGFQKRWSNNSRGNSTFESDRSSTNHSFGGGDNISAYLHPSMLQDPWAHLRKNA